MRPLPTAAVAPRIRQIRFAAVLALACQPAFGSGAIPTITLSAPEAAATAVATTESARGPHVFAHGVPLDLSLRDGVWDEPTPGTARWRLQLHSDSARSISLALSAFNGPESAQLFLRGTTSDVMQGPYAPRTSDADHRLWTAMVPDDTVVVEVLLPAAQREALVLRIDTLYHGFRSPLGPRLKNNQPPSGACNIDVACRNEDTYDDIVRSVALIEFGFGNSRAACTANLVNTTANDDDLLLTAHHCGIRQNNAASVVAYWNFQADDCAPRQLLQPDLSQSTSGSAFVATHEASDHTLLRLNAPPNPAFNVFYSGWDARGDTAAPACGVSIHHPSSDVKKASIFNQAPQRINSFTIDENGGNSQTSDVWQVRWAHGTTEGGSSGAGLWNPQQRIIGVLFGGSASCSVPGEKDVYGRLDVGWEGDGTPSGSMRPYLDPDGVSNRVLDGRNAGASTVTPAAAVDCPLPAPIQPGNGNGNGNGGDESSGGGAWLPLFAVLLMLRRRLPTASDAR